MAPDKLTFIISFLFYFLDKKWFGLCHSSFVTPGEKCQFRKGVNKNSNNGEEYTENASEWEPPSIDM